MVSYTIREMQQSEYALLLSFLYEAIYVPPGMAPPPREIVEQPELQVYVQGFGSQQYDVALAAELGGRVVGAAWARIMRDYGHVDDETPSLAMALYPDYRGQGIGTALLRGLLEQLKAIGFHRVSLSVQQENTAALHLYRQAGFETLSKQGSELLMLCYL